MAEDKGDLVGHVAVSPVFIADGTQHWYGLGPISVAPEWQRQGVGLALMQQVFTEVRKLSAAACVVLGESQYYGRLGFRADQRWSCRMSHPTISKPRLSEQESQLARCYIMRHSKF